MKLTDHIYFYEGDYTSRTPFIYRGMGSSNFLVIKSNIQAMVDSGISKGPHRKRIKAELEKDGIKLRNTATILLSHAHPDHVIHAKNISRKSPVNFIIHQDSEPMAHRSSFLFEAHYNFPEFILREIFKVPVWVARLILSKYFDFEYLRISRWISDYEPVDLGLEAQTIPMPCHFPGHMGVYFPDEKVFYSADLFDFRVAEGGIINNAMSSYSQVFRDIEKVRKLDIDLMIPGHGRFIRGRSMIKVMLDRAEEGTAAYPVKIAKALSGTKKGRTLSALTSSIFHNSNAYNLTARMIILYNTLMYMHSSGEAEFSIKNGTAFWRA